MREGQRLQITGGVETLKGQRGSLKLRFRIDWVEAGNGYHVGAGTWKIMRGTGQCAQLAGGGRRGDVARSWTRGLERARRGLPHPAVMNAEDGMKTLALLLSLLALGAPDVRADKAE